MPAYATWLEINISTLKNNLKIVKMFTRTPVMAVVKANAYGHGLVTTARLLDKTVDWFGVARAEEAMELRGAGVNSPILVLGYCPITYAQNLIANDVSLCVYDKTLIKAYERIAQKIDKPAKVHIKIDTGMTRLGISPNSLSDFTQLIRSLPYLHLEGIFTHFAKADEVDTGYTKQQLGLFQTSLKSVTVSKSTIIHAANSAAIFTQPSAYYDLVRLGISLYGLPPSDNVARLPGIKPALSWKAVITQTRRLKKGVSVSYGGIYTAQRDEIIAVVPAGYGDGFRRTPHHSSKVLIHGHAVPVIGRVCMDQFMVNIDNIKDVEIGDEVVIIGQQNGLEQTAEELGTCWKTFNYEVMTGLSARLPRIYNKA